MLEATKVKISGSEKKRCQEHVRHFFPEKRVTRNFLEVSRLSRAKQRQRNVQKNVLARAKLFFFGYVDLLLFFFSVLVAFAA